MFWIDWWQSKNLLAIVFVILKQVKYWLLRQGKS